MRFTVTWHPSAERELADIWLESTDRNEITRAANSMDELLSLDRWRKARSSTPDYS